MIREMQAPKKIPDTVVKMVGAWGIMDFMRRIAAKKTRNQTK